MGAREITVRNHTAAQSYEALADATVVGSLVYGNAQDRIVFLSTIVSPAYRGKGIAKRLVEAALTDARLQGKTVTDYCGFIAAFIDHHPDYADLVDDKHPGHAMKDPRSARPDPRSNGLGRLSV
jgi:predicted GNAT family acetyltransferase